MKIFIEKTNSKFVRICLQSNSHIDRKAEYFCHFMGNSEEEITLDIMTQNWRFEEMPNENFTARSVEFLS